MKNAQKETTMTNNEIKLTINISDDLLNKFMSAMVKMNSMQAMGGMGLPMILSQAMSPPSSEAKEAKPIGFKSSEKKMNKEDSQP